MKIMKVATIHSYWNFKVTNCGIFLFKHINFVYSGTIFLVEA